MTEAGMRSFRKEPWFDLPRRMGFVDITGQVESPFGTIAILEENFASRQVLFFHKCGPSDQELARGSPACH